MGPGRNDRGNSRVWIAREVENSLRRLDTDRIDLYQVHRPEGATDLEETLGALTDLQRQGKIRYFGSSTFPGWHMVEAQWVAERRGLSRFRTEQPPYSIFVRGIEHDVLPVAQRYGMGVLVWSPLCRGWLTGRYRRDAFDGSPEARAAKTKTRGGAIAEAVRHDPPREPSQARPRRGAREGRRERRRVDDAPRDRLRARAPRRDVGDHRAAHARAAHRPARRRRICVWTTTTLDAIDELVPPGTVVDDHDRGFTPWWFEPQARRR